MYKILNLIILLCCSLSYASYELESIEFVQVKDIQNTSEIETIQQSDLSEVNAASSSIDDLLRLTPIATTGRGPRSSSEAPQVRGLDDNKIFIQIDGAKQSFSDGHSSMVAIDTENLKVIKVIKSPASMNYSGSLAGGIDFVTKEASDILKKNQTSGNEFVVKTQSSNRETSVNAKHVFVKKKTSGLISISQAKAHELHLSDGSVLDHSSYEDFSALVKMSYEKLQIKAEYFRRLDDAPVDGGLNPPSQFTSLLSQNTTTKKNLSLSYSNEKTFNFLSYLNEYMQEKDIEDDTGVEVRSILTKGLKISKNIEFWSFGLESYTDELKSSYGGKSIQSYPRADSETHFLFVEKHLPITESFQIDPAFKYAKYKLKSESELVNQDGDKLSKNISFSYDYKKRLRSIFSYSEGFNAPRVNEVYPSGLHSKGDDFFVKDNFFIPNESLQAEESRNIEFSQLLKKYLLDGYGLFEARVSFYQNQIQNYISMNRIDRSILDDGNGTTQFVNIPRVVLTGKELELSYIYDRYDLRLSYSEIRGENLSENLYLEDLPADHYNFQIKYNIDNLHMTFGYLGHYSLAQTRINPETIQRTDKTEAYLLHNVFATKSFNEFDINLRIDNLENIKYRKHASHLYESERDFKIYFKYKINTI